MEGRLEREVEVSVPAEIVWETYKGLKVGKLVAELLPHIYQKVEAVEGDGGVGTVLDVEMAPGATVFTSFKEKFTEVNDQKRIKVAEVCEGGFLDHGFSLYRVILEIREATATSSIIKSVIEYKADSEADVTVVSTVPFQLIAEAVGKHLAEKHVCVQA